MTSASCRHINRGADVDHDKRIFEARDLTLEQLHRVVMVLADMAGMRIALRGPHKQLIIDDIAYTETAPSMAEAPKEPTIYDIVASQFIAPTKLLSQHNLPYEYRQEFLQLALDCGARLTGKPDGSEPIEVVFPIKAWRTFDKATRAGGVV